MAFPSVDDIVRAWTDPKYRASLSSEQLAKLPPNPAGSSGMSDEELKSVAGGLAAQTCYMKTTCRIQSYNPCTA